MSISIGIIDKEIGVVASDSLVHSGATYDNSGKIIKYAEPFEQPFPKIFQSKLILGAVTGMMDLGGQDITKTITDILEPLRQHSLAETAKYTVEEIRSQIIKDKYSHRSKVLDLILLSREFITHGEFEFYYFRFEPSGIIINVTQKDYRSTKEIKDHSYIFITIGVNSCQTAVHNYFKVAPTKKGNLKKYFTNVSQAAILEGIKYSEKHPDALDSPASGGKPFSICMK